ncbi:polyketide synthase protein [Rutstroemia sp. NJR-2017a BVV2]|nr:polyketide synthase protein [Rutstroemia sp. NJR-2017a BVV2]
MPEGSGYGRGEGVVSVVLKRLDDALQSGDHIRAIIRNTGVNQDGKTNGITMPSSEAQKSLQKSIYDSSGIHPHQVQFVEAHGTGTLAGDTAEIGAIASVFCDPRRPDTLVVGSIKSNIGHLESSSGLAGLVKTVLAIEKGLIPPNADFCNPKTELQMDKWNIRVPTKVEIWPPSEIRRASINSFGYGGTNAHAILESFSPSLKWDVTGHNIHERQASLEGKQGFLPPRFDMESSSPPHLVSVRSTQNKSPSTALPTPQLFIISAVAADALSRVAQRLRHWASFRDHYDTWCHQLAYNLTTRRSIMQYRYTFLADSHESFMAALQDKTVKPLQASPNPSIVFVFTGQGAQWYAMGREMVKFDSQFTKSLWHSDKILRGLGATWSLLDELLKSEVESRINESEIAQPASTALQIALIDFLASLGLVADVVIGHSSGEIAAAYAAGILSSPTALKISYHRGFISRRVKEMQISRGAMLAVGLGEVQTATLLGKIRTGLASVACLNSPTSTTVSGDESAILELAQILRRLDVFHRLLKVDVAYHSHHMGMVSDQYLQALGTIPFNRPENKPRFISSVTAENKIDGFGSDYWVKNLVSKVRFCDALQQYCRSELQASERVPKSIIVELGPHKALASSVRRTLSDFEDFNSTYLPSLERGRNAIASILRLSGVLFAHGATLHLEKLNSFFLSDDQSVSKNVLLDLPTYPWNHSTTYWHESRLSKDYRLRKHRAHDLLGLRLVSSTTIEPTWRHLVNTDRIPWLEQHVVDGLIIFPGAGYLCMAVEAVRQIQSGEEIAEFVLRDVVFLKTLVLLKSKTTELQLRLKTSKDLGTSGYNFSVTALADDGTWYEYSRGSIFIHRRLQGTPDVHHVNSQPSDTSPLATKQVLNPHSKIKTLRSSDIYRNLEQNGNYYGPMFKGVTSLSMQDTAGVASIQVPDVRSIMPAGHIEPHIIHPTTLDSIMHTTLPLYTSVFGPGSVVPVSIAEMRISNLIPNDPGTEFEVSVGLTPKGTRSAEAQITVRHARDLSSTNTPLLSVSSVEVRGLGESSLTKQSEQMTRNMSFQVKWDVDVNYIADASRDWLPVHALLHYVKALYFKRPHLRVLQITTGLSNDRQHPLLKALEAQRDVVIKQNFSNGQREASTNHLQHSPISLELNTINSTAGIDKSHLPAQSFDLVVATLPKQPTHSPNTQDYQQFLKFGGHLAILVDKRASYDSDIQSSLKIDDSYVELPIMSDSVDQHIEHVLLVSRIHHQSCPEILSFQIITQHGTTAIARKLSETLGNQGFESRVVDWDDVKTPTSGEVYLVIDSGINPMLTQPNAELFQKITNILGSKSKVFWVSAHSELGAAMNPAKGLIVGLARTARAENADLDIVTLDAQDCITTAVNPFFNTVVDIAITSFSNSQFKKDGPVELEYIYRQGELLIPRLVAYPKLDALIARDTRDLVAKEIPYLYKNSNVALYLDPSQNFQDRSTTRFLTISSELPAASDTTDSTYVEIAITAHALTPEDLKGLGNKHPQQVLRLRQFSGTVISAGSESSKLYSVGDQVCGWHLAKEAYQNLVRVDADSLAPLPNSIASLDCAAAVIPIMTAYYCIFELAHLQKDHIILIFGADSDIGRMALVLAQQTGAEVLVIVSRPEAKHVLTTNLNVPPENIFLKDEFPMNWKHSGESTGVDAILNVSNSQIPRGVLESIKPFGLYLQVGGPETKIDVRFPDNLRIVSLDLTALVRSRHHKINGLLKKAFGVLSQTQEIGATISAPAKWPLERMIDAVKSYKPDLCETIVLEANEKSAVTAMMPNDLAAFEQRKLDPNSSFVVVGGLGDLGQRACYTLARRGARYIVMISRRALDDHALEELHVSLKDQSPGIQIISLKCDISDSHMVSKTVLELRHMNIPPVKGVIHSAAALRDRALERMSAEDFAFPLQTKLLGTQNLIEAFKDTQLDFFIMFSSLSGLVGTAGQANYAAGNTYQDTVAQYYSHSRTRYMSLNLGLIEDTNVYREADGATRAQNLTRHGFIPVKTAELLAILDFAICPPEEESKCVQAGIGLDPASIRAADKITPTTKSAMFAQLLYNYDHEVVEPSGMFETPKSVRERILEAESSSAMHRILMQALALEIGNQTGTNPELLSMDVSLLSFGLDSLTAIELKNFISRETDASVQASEILDELSVSSLATRILSRSPITKSKPITADHADTALVNDDTLANGSSQSVTEKKVDGVVPTLNGSNDHKLAHMTANEANHKVHSSAAISLPDLPLPNLEDTLELFMAFATPFLTSSELETTHTLVSEFRSGQGKELQKRLLKKAEDPGIDNWLHQIQIDHMWLRRKSSLVFYGTHLDGPIPQTQAERAALIMFAASRFRAMMESGSLDQDYVNGEPICMESLKWLFNTYSIPTLAKYEWEKVSKSDDVVVLRRGHMFRFSISHKGRLLSLLELLEMIQHILVISAGPIPTVSPLSADTRDSWTHFRDLLITKSDGNAKTMEVIEASAFVVCLDDGRPTTSTERSQHFLQGDPSNRWFNKSLQFVVLENGVSGHICSLPLAMANTIKQMNAFVTKTILDYKQVSAGDFSSTNAAENASLDELSFLADEAISTRVSKVLQQTKESQRPLTHKVFRTSDIGGNLFRLHKLPLKTGSQLIMQLASLIHFGRPVSAVELVTTMFFHKGNIDYTMPMTPAMHEFCVGALNPEISKKQKRALLREAARIHANTMMRVARGKGCVMHLEALNAISRDEPVPPALFESKAWKIVDANGPRGLSIDSSEGLLAQESGYMMADPTTPLIHYEVEENACLFWVQGLEAEAGKLIYALEKATEIVATLLSHDGEEGETLTD